MKDRIEKFRKKEEKKEIKEKMTGCGGSNFF